MFFLFYFYESKNSLFFVQSNICILLVATGQHFSKVQHLDQFEMFDVSDLMLLSCQYHCDYV